MIKISKSREFSYIQVFKDIDESGTNDCFKNLRIEVLPKRRVLFHFGTTGNRFYIILEGQVEIWIPEYSEDDKIEPCAFKKVLILGQG